MYRQGPRQAAGPCRTCGSSGSTRSAASTRAWARSLAALTERRLLEQGLQLPAFVAALAVVVQLPPDGQNIGGHEERPHGREGAGGDPDEQGHDRDEDAGDESGERGVPVLPAAWGLVFFGGAGEVADDGVGDGPGYEDDEDRGHFWLVSLVSSAWMVGQGWGMNATHSSACGPVRRRTEHSPHQVC